MALSDYSTAVEKIAAYKCAMIDPALVQFSTTGFTATENIFILNTNFSLNGNLLYSGSDSSDSLHTLFVAGDVVLGSLLYVKDSDIVYPDPVELYQNRLSSIITSQVKLSNNETAGANGIIVTRTPGDASNDSWSHVHLYINGSRVLSGPDSQKGCNVCLPVGPGMVVTSASPWYNNNFTYFDVPSDW